MISMIRGMANQETFWLGTTMAHGRSNVPKDCMKKGALATAAALPKAHYIVRHTKDGEDYRKCLKNVQK